MIHNGPKLLCTTLLFYCLLFSGSIAVAQLDLETANIIIAYETEELDNSLEPISEDIIFFKETGKGQLTKGSAEIKIDPEIANKIEGKRIDDLVTVAIQMEGKSNGVYVSRKDKDTFVITELGSGNSNTPFSYKFTVSAPN